MLERMFVTSASFSHAIFRCQATQRAREQGQEEGVNNEEENHFEDQECTIEKAKLHVCQAPLLPTNVIGHSWMRCGSGDGLHVECVTATFWSRISRWKTLFFPIECSCVWNREHGKCDHACMHMHRRWRCKRWQWCGFPDDGLLLLDDSNASLNALKQWWTTVVDKMRWFW